MTDFTVTEDFRCLHDGTSGQGMLMFTSLANVDVLGTEPIGLVPACFAYEPDRPLDTGQIVVTGINVSEPLVKFNFGSRKKKRFSSLRRSRSNDPAKNLAALTK